MRRNCPPKHLVTLPYFENRFSSRMLSKSINLCATSALLALRSLETTSAKKLNRSTKNRGLCGASNEETADSKIGRQVPSINQDLTSQKTGTLGVEPTVDPHFAVNAPFALADDRQDHQKTFKHRKNSCEYRSV